MKIHIENLLAIRSGDMALKKGKTTTLTGENAVGKSSAAVILGSLLSHDPNPFDLPTKDRKEYVSDGVDGGYAALLDDDDGMLIKWSAPSGEISAPLDGLQPLLPHVVGMLEFHIHRSPTERRKIWDALFTPKASELLEEAKKIKGVLSDEALDYLCETLEKTDSSPEAYDLLIASFKERATDKKRLWSQVTGGKTWGEKAAAKWLPAGWSPELDSARMEDLQGEEKTLLEKQEAFHEWKIRQKVRDEDYEKARGLVGDLEKEVALAQTAHAGAHKNHEELNENLRALIRNASLAQAAVDAQKGKKSVQTTVYACPSCKAPLVLRAGELHRHSVEQHEEISRKWEIEGKRLADILKKKREDEKAGHSAVRQAADAVNKTVHALKGATANLKMVNETIKAWQEGKDAPSAEDQSVALTEVREKIALITAKRNADKTNQSILHYLSLARFMGHDGVRGKIMQKQMTVLDQVLQRVHEITGWARVRISDDGNLRIGNRGILKLCAESERLRAQFALQIGIAVVKRQPVVVLDRVDILDDANLAIFKDLLRRFQQKLPLSFFIAGTEINIEGFDGFHYRIEKGRVIEAG